jgi:uncharacterized protein YktA (UPF0223 family)
MFNSITELLKKINPDVQQINIYLEAGVPYLFLYQLISNNFNVFVVDGQEVNKFRGKREKTDEKDVEYIKDLYYQVPILFKELTLEDKNLVHAKYLVSKYIHFTKIIVRLKNQEKAFERHFGEMNVYKYLIKDIEIRRKKIIIEILPFLKEDIQKIQIAGVGNVLSMQILTSAHPKNFTSQSAYLAYCGYIGNVGTKYNRLAKTTAYQMAKSCIMHKNPTYYPLYIKIKEDLKLKFIYDNKLKNNNRAINRLSTFILKEIYQKVKN